jgi:hypothetical protein
MFICLLAILAAKSCSTVNAAEAGSESIIAPSPSSAREREFSELVAVRARAIETALGPLLEGACAQVYIEFAKPSQPSYPKHGPAEYDSDRHVLTFRRALIESIDYDVSYWASSYWPYYQRADLRAMMPMVEIIDDALWLTHLREAAHQKGMSWPHAECSSLEVAERLGCEMLLTAVRASVRSPQGRMFNANRIDMLWPDDLTELRSHAWRQDVVYRDVQRLGGVLLVRPLVEQFGVPRVLRYIAQNPFHIENDNVRTSALQYQERARQALGASAIN